MILLIESVSLVDVLELNLSAASYGKTLLGTGVSFDLDLRHNYILLKVYLLFFGETNITRLRPSILDGLSTTPNSEMASLKFFSSSSPNWG